MSQDQTNSVNESADSSNPANWTRQVIDNLFEAEKKWLELAAQQNNLVLKTIREVFALYQTAPNPTMANWARQGIETFVEAQRKWIENAAQQQASFLNTQRPADLGGLMGAMPSLDVNNSGQAAANYTQQQTEYLAAARKRWLDLAAQQNAQFLKAVRESMGITDNTPAAAVTEWVQQAVDNYVEVQKRWLNLASQWTFPRPFNQK